MDAGKLNFKLKQNYTLQDPAKICSFLFFNGLPVHVKLLSNKQQHCGLKY